MSAADTQMLAAAKENLSAEAGLCCKNWRAALAAKMPPLRKHFTLSPKQLMCR